MSIPTNFSEESLADFKFSSNKLVGTERQYSGLRGKLFVPCEGKRFVRIDDPRAVDSDGLRTPEAHAAAKDLTNVAWLPHLHPDDTLTYGGRGAWLECQNVGVPKGKALWFRFAFLRFGSLPTNAFATLLAFPDGADPLPPVWIFDVKQLEEDQFGANQTEWTECVVSDISASADFLGTIRWVVGTGHNVADKQAIPDGTRFARPGCLLIDAIGIS
jgi:hypothetical protein